MTPTEEKTKDLEPDWVTLLASGTVLAASVVLIILMYLTTHAGTP